jgi:hypothetical protein
MDSHQAYVYSCCHYNCFIYLFIYGGNQMWITSYFKHKSFQEVVGYPRFEHVEIVGHPPYQIFDFHISFTMSISREETILSMVKVFITLRHMQ